MAAFCFFGFVQILYESLWIIIGGICRLLPLSSNLACSKIHHVLSICCCCCCCCCCWCAFSAMFDCHRVRHTNSHGYTGCRRHGVNPAVQPAAQDHNCDFDHKGKGREILAKNNPNISIKGHESWSARRLKTTDFYWIRLKNWTNLSYICIIYIYILYLCNLLHLTDTTALNYVIWCSIQQYIMIYDMICTYTYIIIYNTIL